MKLSLRWIFDHLGSDWKKCNIDSLVTKFNATTAEIECVEKVTLDVDKFALARVGKITSKEVLVECLEWEDDFSLSNRTDLSVGDIVVIKDGKKSVEWANVLDWGGIKDKLLPAMKCSEKDLSGGWKKSIEKDDYIIEVDNKSVTNRPDLWGHRGFAREFSFLLKAVFHSDKKFLAALKQKSADKKYSATKNMPFNISIDAKGCNRFSALVIENIEYTPSELWMSLRLCRIESSPIDFIVDSTNYAMFDWGQPIHAFDAAMFKKKTITARMAKKNEKLTTLSGVDLELTTDDMVITDGSKPVSLAGIKGGLNSGISKDTTSLLVESANFDPGMIRKTAALHKTRTDASARFEKTPDKNQNVEGTMRFVQLLKDAKLPIKCSKDFVSLGKPAKHLTIKIAHDFIEDRLGVELKKGEIKKLLETIGFTVSASGSSYSVKVPTNRSSKDVTIPEDIVEEVGRLYGYKNIPLVLPEMKLIPSSQSVPQKIQSIMQQLAFDGCMREVQNYGFFDNEFLRQIGWKVTNGLKVANPIAEQVDTMVTSLVPRLLKNVETNSANHDNLRFFEWAKTWDLKKKDITEIHTLSGVMFNKKKIDFYEEKAVLNRLFEMMGLDVAWKPRAKKIVWAHKYQSSDLYCGKTYIGTAGIVTLPMMAAVAKGEAFAFELNGTALIELQPKEQRFAGMPKYQATTLDVSVMVPLSETVAELAKTIINSDERIFDVSLVDIFKKDDWEDKKSVTMRFSLRDEEKTLSKDEIDACYQSVEKSLSKLGAEVR